MDQYLYGGKTNIKLPNSDIFSLQFDSFIDKIPIDIIKGKGIPDINNIRGDLFLQYKIKGVNS